MLPEDVVIGNEFSDNAKINISSVYTIPKDGKDWMQALNQLNFSQIIQKSKTIFWNGPIGVFELDLFQTEQKHWAKKL